MTYNKVEKGLLTESHERQCNLTSLRNRRILVSGNVKETKQTTVTREGEIEAEIRG